MTLSSMIIISSWSLLFEIPGWLIPISLPCLVLTLGLSLQIWVLPFSIPCNFFQIADMIYWVKGTAVNTFSNVVIRCEGRKGEHCIVLWFMFLGAYVSVFLSSPTPPPCVERASRSGLELAFPSPVWQALDNQFPVRQAL